MRTRAHSTRPPSWDWADNTPAPDGHSFLQINGLDVDWGPFSNGDTGHRYSIEITGSGAPLMFQIHDWLDEDYSNNRCHLRVKIYGPPGDFYGGTPGFWKRHLDEWQGPDPADSICSVFSEASDYVDCGDTLLDALKYHGGRGADGAARILLRAAVAAVLNAEHNGINYPLITAEIVEMVNNALAGGIRSEMINLAKQLDDMNNLGTPWD